MAGIVLGVVVALSAGLLIIWKFATQTEEKLARDAGQAYSENRFNTAAGKYRELTEKYQDSPQSDEYRFMIELSEFRDQAANGADNPEDKLKRVVQFNKDHEASPFFKAHGREIAETSVKVLLDCAAKVKEQGNAKALTLADQAQQSLAELERINRDGIHAAEHKQIEEKLAEARAAVALNEQHQRFVARLEELAADPGVDAFKKASSLIDQETKVHPDWRADADASLTKLRGGMLARVTYTDEPAGVGKPPVADEDERCWLVSPPVRPLRGAPPGREDQVVFALARGILYALRQSDGEIKWFTRVGVDTSVLPVHVPAAGTRKELVLVASADTATLTARDAQTGEQIWKRRLSASCLGRPVLVDDRVYAATYDGQVHEMGLADGKFLGRYELGKDVHVSLGAAREEGSTRLYVAADDSCVYVLDVGKTAADRKKTPCEKIVYAGHANGSLRSAPLVVSEGVHGYLILFQADGLERCRLRVFPVQTNPFIIADAPPDLGAEVRGWPWFQPYCDGDKLAVVTDAGVFSLFGIQQPGNPADRTLFPEVSQDITPGGVGSGAPESERALVVHGDADTFWILMRGRLRKRSLTFHRQLGPQLIERWPQSGTDASLRLGAPLHASQVWRRPSPADDGGDVLFLVTQLDDGQSCWATAVDAMSGKIQWQRQLGLMPETDPLVLGPQVLALDQGGGLFAFDSAFDAGAQPASATDSPWLASSDSAAKPFLDGSSAPPHLLRAGDGSAYALGFTGSRTHLVVRHFRPTPEGKRYEVKSVELDLKFPLAGTPGVTQDSLVLPLADGIVWRLPLPPREGQEAVPGLSWRGSRREAESGGYLVGIGGSEFVASNGNRGLTRWSWSADNFMSTMPTGAKVPSVSLPARVSAAPVVLRPVTDPAGLQLCVADVRGTLTLLGSDLKPVRSWDLNGKLTAGPFVQGGQIGCVVDRHRLLWFDPNQDLKPLWEYRSLSQGIVGQPQWVEDQVVVADQSGLFVGLDPKTGQKRGDGYRLKANVAPAVTPVAFGKDRAFAPLTDGTVLLLPLHHLRIRP